LRKQFENGHLDGERIKSLLGEMRVVNATVEREGLAYAAKKHFDRLSEKFFHSPENIDKLRQFTDSTALLPLLPLEVNLWRPQNTFYQVAATVLPEMRRRNDEASRAWVENFQMLGARLNFQPDLNPEEP
jgi:hypothetical protein